MARQERRSPLTEKFVASIWFKSRVSHRASGKIVNEAGESLNEMRRDWFAQGRHFGADRHSARRAVASPESIFASVSEKPRSASATTVVMDSGLGAARNPQ
jgi:hypothetical protein